MELSYVRRPCISLDWFFLALLVDLLSHCQTPTYLESHSLANSYPPLTSTDDMILLQLGRVREGTTGQEQQQYIDGMKRIIADMRRDKINDLNSIASQISSYRRQYLQDPSRVLTL